MMTTAQKRAEQDIPASAAIAFLALVLGGLTYFKSPATAMAIYHTLDRYSSAHGEFLSLVLFSSSLNGIWLYSVLSRLLGVNQQGKRLEILTGKGKKQDKSLGLSWPSVGAGLIGTCGTYWIVTHWSPGVIPNAPGPWAIRLGLLIAGNFGFSAFVLAAALERSGFRFGRGRNGKLPDLPKLTNGIVLAAEGEESAAEGAKWVVMNQRALNGNILITGSIGTGKTQGTVLPYLDQILANFDPKPSILAIDPKGTFIPEALKIIEKHGLSDKVLHLTLGGEVTFNPVFTRNPLKESAFFEVAQMVRAAASNFDSYASKQDSAFWENSSFHLIRGAIACCAATKGYYTLQDIYGVMVRADSEDFAGALRDATKGGLFDEEEMANIRFAMEYFEEEFNKLESKVKTSILATATSFLNQFQEYQASRIFCPPREKLALPSLDEAVKEGKILLFDVGSPGLARSMGTFVKLHYESALLRRMRLGKAATRRAGLLIVDEYQDVVSVGSGGTLGDGGFLAKGREGNSITIAATQSLTSLENAIGRSAASRELVQTFRTRIAAHSTDIYTIRQFQELAGFEERARESHSVSEMSQHASRNLMVGGFEAKDANISESFSTSAQKEHRITGGDFARLNSFEAFGLVYDGVATEFKKIFLKPYFLSSRRTAHKKVLESLRAAVLLAGIILGQNAFSFPNVCTVAKTDEFRSCLNFSVGACVCPGIPPRPCAKLSYYVPQTFVEVMPDPKSSYFGSLPGAALQLQTVGDLPYGTEADTDSQSFQAHTIAVPLAAVPFSLLSCGGARFERFCFDGMSEHLGMNWNTGLADSLQPNFLAWSLSPKACLIKGAVTSAVGGSESMPNPGGPACSIPMSWLPKYPPSSHEACNGWGLFYPRCGTYSGPSQTMGALMIGARMKSLSSEVFHSTPGSSDEKWQMISPQSSSCFREGQNVGLLETVKGVRELGRLTSGKMKGHLFVVWSKVDCCRDFAEVPETLAAIEAMIAACKGLGTL